MNNRNNNRIVIFESSGSGKINSLFNLKINQPDIDKLYLYAKDPYEVKDKLLIKKHDGAALKHFNDS